jgi:hypothetical protein
LDLTLPFWAFLIFLAVAAAAFLLARTRSSIKSLFLAGVAGFCGMILQNVLLLHYQVKDGALYQDLGLLIASFMAGMALGAIFIPRCLFLPDRRWGGLLLGGFFILATIIYFTIVQDGAAGILAIASLLAFSGFFTGSLFAYTTLGHAEEDSHTLFSPLYAADLIGGASGALLGGLLLIPLIGLDIPIQIVGALILLSFLIV